MEFEIKTDLEKSLPAVIEFNFEPLKAWLEAQLGHYNNLVVTEDSIKSGKEDRAKLNNLIKSIEEQRKTVKKQCLAPYEAFEAQCKELTGMVGGAVQAIDVQIKTFEEQEKAEKRKLIEHFYKTNAKELIDLVPLDKLWDDKWLNKGTDSAKYSKEIIDGLNKARNDIGIIRKMKLENEQFVLDAYLKHLDMSEALAEKARFEEQQKRLQELSKAKEAKEPQVVIVDGEHGFENCKPGDVVRFGSGAETPVAPKESKDIRAIFYNTTPEFRSDMRELCQRHGIKCGRC